MSYPPTSPCLAERMSLLLLKNALLLCHVTRDFLNVLVINKLRAFYLIEKKKHPAMITAYLDIKRSIANYLLYYYYYYY